ARDVLSPFIRRNREGPSTIAAIIPAASSFENGATGKTLGFYAQDVYKPFPNLSLSFGVRFDREIDQSFGYSFFEPAAERARFDLLMSLAGNEAGKSDASGGDNNGVTSLGVQSDQLFAGSPDIRLATSFITDPLKLAAISRLTRHHIESTFTLPGIANLFPGDFVNGQIDPRRLAQHGVFPQRREAFAITNNNLAPRLGISWDPSSTGRTKIFATWGRYYDKLFLSSVVAEEGPDVINRYYLLDPNGANGLGVPNHQIGRILSDAPPSTHQVDRQLKTPYSDELTLGFEREIAPEVALSLRYISRRFRDQLQDIDVNHSLRLDPYTGQPLDDFGRVGTIISGAATRQPDGRPDLYIQNFFFNQVLRLGNFNEARYRAIEFAAVKRLARRWELQGSYTYSRVVGGAEDFQSRLGNDPSTVEEEFGYLDYDQRHVVKLNAITFLPHDWQLGLSMGWSSGLPYSIISRFFALDNADYQQFRTRYGRTLYNPVTGAPHFEPLRRNSERNAAVYDVNVRAKKALVIGRHAAAAYIEVFNLLNSDDLRIFTYSPDQPDRFSASPNGVPVQEALQLDATRRFGRRFQFGFQFDF
ncbi:MAG TPA: TonB-dependent receptor, partial [Candidatus Polarisedimenticolia bacterium]|nr:TonB-dependent receptor [Candidatus Polarisedimenticolia bacterium]